MLTQVKYHHSILENVLAHPKSCVAHGHHQFLCHHHVLNAKQCLHHLRFLSPSSSTVAVSETTSDSDSLVASIGEPLCTDYGVHELPVEETESHTTLSFSEK